MSDKDVILEDNRSIAKIIRDELKNKLTINISSMGAAYSCSTDIDVELCYDGEVIASDTVTIVEGEN